VNNIATEDGNREYKLEEFRDYRKIKLFEIICEYGFKQKSPLKKIETCKAHNKTSM
jgi:hypothetical protein